MLLLRSQRPIAQLVELLSYKQVVVGSNPAGPIFCEFRLNPYPPSEFRVILVNRYSEGVPQVKVSSKIHSTSTHRSFFMAAAYLPSILVPLVGLVFPAVAMASLFLYIEKEEIA